MRSEKCVQVCERGLEGEDGVRERDEERETRRERDGARMSSPSMQTVL